MLIRTSAAIFLLLATGCGSRGATGAAAQTSKEKAVELSVDPRASILDMQRVGVNLGSWTSWGAEQLAANVIKNPGFEGVIDRGLATVKTPAGNGFTVDGYQTRPEDFWQGAEVVVRSGPAAGETARVIAFHVDTSQQHASVAMASTLPLADGDVVALTKSDSSGPPTEWWIPDGQAFCGSGPPRPGSPGRRSFLLCPSGAKSSEVNSFLDAIGDRAGKLLPVNGRWRLSFWSRAAKGTSVLQVSLRRQPSATFFDRKLIPSPAWQPSVIEFEGRDSGPAGTLQLQFRARGDGEIDLDDVSLEHESDGEFPFRTEVVGLLERLQPAYLRDWQGQLGDTVQNRLAPDFARQASRYRSSRREDAQYGYSIPDFFRLCSRVAASPWLVLPTTASDEEYRALGTYLREAQARFHFIEILVEFGNENWNPLFATAGIADARRHGEVSSRAFSLLRGGAGATVPLRTVINAQFANPRGVREFAGAANADVVAVAPYFAFNLPAGADAAQTGKLLFAPATEAWRQISSGIPEHRELAVYEINLHTVLGDAPAGERDDFVLSAAAGTALAQRLIEGMEAGIRRQCVYSLSGYDSFTNTGRNLVQLFGLARDLAGGAKLRSTGLAVVMLNQAVQAEVHLAHASGGEANDGITAIAFHGPAGWSAVLASRRDRRVEVRLQFPAASPGRLPQTVLTLTEPTASAPEHSAARLADSAPAVVAGPAQLRANSVWVPVPARGLVALVAGEDVAGKAGRVVR